MNFTSVDIHLFANCMSASSFMSCLHTEETLLVSGGLLIIYTITADKLTFLKSVALCECATKINDMCESVFYIRGSEGISHLCEFYT